MTDAPHAHILAGLDTPVLKGWHTDGILRLADDRDNEWYSLSSGERDIVDLAVMVREIERRIGAVDSSLQQRIREALGML